MVLSDSASLSDPHLNGPIGSQKRYSFLSSQPNLRFVCCCAAVHGAGGDVATWVEYSRNMTEVGWMHALARENSERPSAAMNSGCCTKSNTRHITDHRARSAAWQEQKVRAAERGQYHGMQQTKAAEHRLSRTSCFKDGGLELAATSAASNFPVIERLDAEEYPAIQAFGQRSRSAHYLEKHKRERPATARVSYRMTVQKSKSCSDLQKHRPVDCGCAGSSTTRPKFKRGLNLSRSLSMPYLLAKSFSASNTRSTRSTNRGGMSSPACLSTGGLSPRPRLVAVNPAEKFSAEDLHIDLGSESPQKKVYALRVMLLRFEAGQSFALIEDEGEKKFIQNKINRVVRNARRRYKFQPLSSP